MYLINMTTEVASGESSNQSVFTQKDSLLFEIGEDRLGSIRVRRQGCDFRTWQSFIARCPGVPLVVAAQDAKA